MGIPRLSFERLLKSAECGDSVRLEVQIGGSTFIRNFLPEERLLLLGGGHICQPLCAFSSELDFSVTVADDRPSFANSQRFPAAKQVICDSFPNAIRRFDIRGNDYVVIITRGHRWDADCLREILSGTFPRYLGMIGSRRRTSALLKLLKDEGFPPELLTRIHTPVGLDIGALTPKEISISILAELIACRRADTRSAAKSNILVSEDTDLNLLRFLASPEKKKALLLVYETFGSTPVRSGAFMAVSGDFQTCGTIGGGCSESAAVHEAFHMIGTGAERCTVIDMSGDIAEEEGMVCGGMMKVFIADVTG